MQMERHAVSIFLLFLWALYKKWMLVLNGLEKWWTSRQADIK
jgi:hypothetical protein